MPFDKIEANIALIDLTRIQTTRKLKAKFSFLCSLTEFLKFMLNVDQISSIIMLFIKSYLQQTHVSITLSHFYRSTFHFSPKETHIENNTFGWYTWMKHNQYIRLIIIFPCCLAVFRIEFLHILKWLNQVYKMNTHIDFCNN